MIGPMTLFDVFLDLFLDISCVVWQRATKRDSLVDPVDVSRLENQELYHGSCWEMCMMQPGVLSFWDVEMVGRLSKMVGRHLET